MFSRMADYERGRDPVATNGPVSTPYSVTVLRDRIKPDKDKKWSTPRGLWLCEFKDGTHHYLPRASITEKLSATQYRIDPYQFFKEGDELTVVEPSLTITVGAMALNDTTTITISGASASFTFEQLYGTTTSDAATEIAEKINNSILSSKVSAKSTLAEIYLYSTDSTLHTVAISGQGTLTASDSGTMVAMKPFGTVLSFDPDDPTLMNLSGAATNEVPVGGHVGVEGQIKQIKGFDRHSAAWDYRMEQLRAGHTAAHVYRRAFPYLDKQIESQFTGPSMQFIDA